MRHWSDPGGLDGLELVDHGDDARQLGRDVRDFSRRDLEPGEAAQSFYVFGSKHGVLGRIIELGREVIDFSLDNTRRLWIGLPVATVAPRFPLAALGLNVKELSGIFL